MGPSRSSWGVPALLKVDISPCCLFPAPFWSSEVAPKRTFSITLLGTAVRL